MHQGIKRTLQDYDACMRVLPKNLNLPPVSKCY